MISADPLARVGAGRGALTAGLAGHCQTHQFAHHPEWVPAPARDPRAAVPVPRCGPLVSTAELSPERSTISRGTPCTNDRFTAHSVID